MRLKIPPSQRDALKDLIGLSETQFTSLLLALKDAEPLISGVAMADSIASRVDLPSDRLRSIVLLAGSLYLTRDQRAVTAAEFANALVEASAQEGLIDRADVVLGSRLKKNIADLLSLDSSLGVSAKATQLLVRHKNPLSTARIFTDIRPVFAGAESPTPQAAVLVHTLELVTSTDGRQLSHYIALDSGDLKVMKRIIDRALQKETSLRKAISNFPVLQVKETEE